MMKRFHTRKNLGAVVVGSIALAIGVASVQPSFAGKGGPCRAGSSCSAGQVRQMCNSAMLEKGLKGAERQAEFEKCKGDPTSYK